MVEKYRPKSTDTFLLNIPAPTAKELGIGEHVLAPMGGAVFLGYLHRSIAKGLAEILEFRHIDACHISYPQS